MIGNQISCANCESMSRHFQKLTNDELARIAESKVHIKFKKKEIVAKQGSFASHIIFIKGGLLKLYIESETDDKDLIINFFSSGELLGLSSLFEKNAYKYTVSTMEESELCLIEVSEVKKLIADNAEFAISLLKRSHKSTIHAYSQMYNLTHKQLGGRIASALIYLSEIVFKTKKFKLVLTCSELANFTAMSTMSDVRAINDLKDQKIISDKKGIVEILNMEALQRISKFG